MADSGRRRSKGLGLTLRQQMIGVVYFALVFTIAGAVRGDDGKLELFAGVLWSIVLTPWILGFLVLCLDRPGPFKNWAVLTLFVSFPIALALGHDWIAMAELAETGTIARPLNTLAINGVLLGSFAAYWHFMGPAKCPACARTALIPLLTPWGRTLRTTKTRWCARCGSLYWRRASGPWQIERRRTWLDTVDAPVDEPVPGAACPGFDGVAPAAGDTQPGPGLEDVHVGCPTLASAAPND